MPSDQPPGSGPSAGEPPDRFDHLPAGFEHRNPFDALRSEWATAYEDMPRVNIMTTGKAGVGKSTLVNAIFRKPLARTGAGDRVTDHIEQYSDPELPLTLYDAPGIELGDKEAQEVAVEFLKLIESKYRSNPNEHIHLIYYCIHAEDRRLEDYQVELIKTFADAVSVIPVLTQCLGRGEQEVVEFARYLEGRGLPVVGSPIRTLAIRRIIAGVAIEPFGLDELARVSYREIPDVRRRAFANALRVSIDLKIKQAYKVVSSATMVAGGIGLVPSPPVVDTVLLFGIQLRMIARINVALGFDRMDVETIGSALVGPLGSSMIGRSASRFMLRFFPFAGNAINAALAVSSTRTLGAAYIEGCAQVLRRQLAGETVSAGGLQEAARAVLENLKRGTPHPGVQSEPQEGPWLPGRIYPAGGSGERRVHGADKEHSAPTDIFDSSAPRQVNAWLGESEGGWREGELTTVLFDIGPRRSAAVVSGHFVESPPPVDDDGQWLYVLLLADAASVRPVGTPLWLPAEGPTAALRFEVTPTRPGPLVLCFRVFLERGSLLLQELTATVEVAGESIETRLERE